jgi:hypothetical protein
VTTILHQPADLVGFPSSWGAFVEMQFSLVYDGDLPSIGNSTPPLRQSKLQAVWAVRDVISRQLDRLYETHPILRGAGFTENRMAANEARRPIRRHGQTFLALARPELRLKCQLDIKMLVNHEPGSVLTGTGDLDNRIKTLNDALRVPKEQHEMGSHQVPAGQAYICLMSDDALVTGFKVAMDRHLGLVNQTPHYVHLDIGVTVTPSERTHLNLAFSSD